MSMTDYDALNGYEVFARFPSIAGRDNPDLLSAYQELAALMEVEGILDGLDGNDARHVAAGAAVDAMVGSAALERRASWVLTPDGGAPLHDPSAVSRALLRMRDLYVAFGCDES